MSSNDFDTVRFGGFEVSYLIEFGLDDEYNVEVTNRRRVTPEDMFDENTHEFVGVIVGQPDRVFEPVAVIVRGSAVGVLNRMTDKQRLALYDRGADGLELLAVRVLIREYHAQYI